MRAKKNAITGLMTQLIIIALGLIVPRIMITNYGSDTNGLTNTLTQIFSYVALLEAGIGQSTKNALYKPITEKDKDGICRILSVSRKYYWKITKYYAGVVILMAVLLPFVLKTELSAKTVFAVVFFEGMSGVIRFMFTENWMQLLMAEGKGYVQANITLITRLLTYGVKIVLACMKVNIVAIQFGFFCVSLIQLAIYKWYIEKNYGWIKYDLKSCENIELPDKNAYVLTEIAWTVFSSTDMILLSILFSTALSSVYSVYNLVYSNISGLMNSVYTSLIYLLGQAYSESLRKYEQVHDEFELMFMTGAAILMSCCSVLGVAFVRLYTKGVTDTNYIYVYLPILFGLIQILSWNRYVSGNLSGIAGYAKIVSKISVIEAVSNIVLSVILAPKMGLYGITLATVISLVFKLVYLTYLGNVVILKRYVRKSCAKIIAYLALYFSISFAFVIKPLAIESFVQFILYGIITFLFVSLAFSVAAYFLDRQTFKSLIKRVGLKRKKS